MKLLYAVVGSLAFLSVVAANAQDAAQAPSMLAANSTELPKVFAVRITVADLARSERFYHDGLGAQIRHIHSRESMAQFASGPGVVLAQGGPRAAGAPVPEGAGGFLLQVADIDALVARVAAAGGSVERPPNSGTAALSYGVRSALIRDPDGVGIEVIQRPTGR